MTGYLRPLRMLGINGHINISKGHQLPIWAFYDILKKIFIIEIPNVFAFGKNIAHCTKVVLGPNTLPKFYSIQKLPFQLSDICGFLGHLEFAFVLQFQLLAWGDNKKKLKHYYKIR